MKLKDNYLKLRRQNDSVVLATDIKGDSDR